MGNNFYVPMIASLYQYAPNNFLNSDILKNIVKVLFKNKFNKKSATAPLGRIITKIKNVSSSPMFYFYDIEKEIAKDLKESSFGQFDTFAKSINFEKNGFYD
jgi:hypothetical protein